MVSKNENLQWLRARTAEYRLAENDTREVVEDFDKVGKLGQGFVAVNDLEEIDVGEGTMWRPTYVNANLSAAEKEEVHALLKQFVGCFTWEYMEMLGLGRGLVEHHLPIKMGFCPHKQPTRSFSPKIVGWIKEEIDKLLKVGFVQPCWYAEWVSNVVPVEKKNTGKIRVCIDFQDRNRATLKDGYPMPVADMLVNSMSGNKVISFMDDNARYNQIFMAKEDVHKTAFRCPGFVGLFEWIVMMFELRNAGATYQRAMNLIFHDLLGILMEVHIHDVVIKLACFIYHLDDLRVALERMKKYGLRMNPFKCAFEVYVGRFLGFIVHEHGRQIDPKKIESIQKI
jgi:hypothetical protein